jgi:hypothetical protein
VASLFFARSSLKSTSLIGVSNTALWALRVVVALQCLGAAWAASVDMSSVGGTLFFEWGVSESMAILVEQVGVALLVVSAGAVLAFRSRVAPMLVAAWFLVLAALHVYRGGAVFSDWAMGAHAVRYVAPAALAVLIEPVDDFVDREAVKWLLRAAIAATFVTHGLEALSQHPRFVDYLLVASDRLVGYELAEPVARRMLVVIGTMDITLAVLVLVRRQWRWVLLWMVFWGVLTACSRIVFGGWDKGYMALERAANGGLPLVLYLFLKGDEGRRRATHRI